MALELKQSLRLSQQLVMTLQLQQAIKLLQFSHLELAAFIQQELEKNPLLQETQSDDGPAVEVDAGPLEGGEDANQGAAQVAGQAGPLDDGEHLHLAEGDARLIVAGAEISVAGQRRHLQAARAELVPQPRAAVAVQIQRRGVGALGDDYDAVVAHLSCLIDDPLQWQDDLTGPDPGVADGVQCCFHSGSPLRVGY